MDTIRQLVDRRNKEYLPVSIILVTSHADVPALKGAMKAKEVDDNGLSGVYYAGTPLKGAKVYGLAGVIGPNGSGDSYASPSNVVNQSASSLGNVKLSKEGLDDPMALKAWWYLANGVYDAYPQVKKLSKRKGAAGEQANILLKRVDSYLAEELAAALKNGISDITAYEKAERLLAALSGAKIKELKKDTGALKKLIKSSAKADGMKEELKARQGYEKLMKLVVSNNPKEKAQAIDGFRYISDTYAETHYGKLSSMRASSLAGL